MKKVYRKQRIEGTSCWGIIQNGMYFLSPLDIYQDGIIGCWKQTDLWQFKEILEQGWVVPYVDNGKSLDIFELGCFKVKQAEWLNPSTDTYYAHIKNIVQQLNPEMENLYRTTCRETEKWKSHRTSFTASSTSFKITQPIGYFCDDGKDCSIFYRKEGTLYLSILTAYKDGTLEISTDPNVYYSWEEIENMLQNQTLCVCPKPNEWVTIEHLGKVLFEHTKNTISQKDKIATIVELRKDIMNLPTASQSCISAYHDYLENPNEYTKETLRQAYEAVPECERCYLGDMDTRDSDYIRILYTNETREV